MTENRVLNPQQVIDLLTLKKRDIHIMWETAAGTKEAPIHFQDLRRLLRDKGTVWGYGPRVSDKALLKLFQLLGKTMEDSLTLLEFLQAVNSRPQDARGYTHRTTEHPFAYTQTNADSANKADLREIRRLTAAFEDHKTEIRSVFDSLDVDGNGVVTLDELQAGLDRLGGDWGIPNMGDRFLLELFDTIDLDKNGVISFDEFAKGIEAKKIPDIKHVHVTQNPMFATSSASVGSVRPSHHHVPQSYYGRAGNFTKEFQGGNYRNHGLN